MGAQEKNLSEDLEEGVKCKLKTESAYKREDCIDQK